MERDKFLQLMSLLESSGGKNTDHKQVTRGIQSGDSAQGQYGVMPNTVKEFQNRARLSNKPVPQTPEEVANAMAEHLENKTDDPEKQAYMWEYGHNLNPDDIDEDKLNKNLRIQRFRELQKKLGIENPKARSTD